MFEGNDVVFPYITFKHIKLEKEPMKNMIETWKKHGHKQCKKLVINLYGTCNKHDKNMHKHIF
jgi:hypothetical protein